MTYNDVIQQAANMLNILWPALAIIMGIMLGMGILRIMLREVRGVLDDRPTSIDWKGYRYGERDDHSIQAEPIQYVTIEREEYDDLKARSTALEADAEKRKNGDQQTEKPKNDQAMVATLGDDGELIYTPAPKQKRSPMFHPDGDE